MAPVQFRNYHMGNYARATRLSETNTTRRTSVVKQRRYLLGLYMYFSFFFFVEINLSDFYMRRVHGIGFFFFPNKLLFEMISRYVWFFTDYVDFLCICFPRTLLVLYPESVRVNTK